MKELVQVKNDKKYGLTTTSRIVAQGLGKRHSHVIRDLENILENPNVGSLIIPTFYRVNNQKRQYKEYLLTKDGFTLYMFNIQGYNDFKMAYINEFNRMEKILKQRSIPQNQPKEEYKIEPKTYKGKPVLVMRDLEYLFNKNITMLYETYMDTNLERNVLRDKELKLFIKENSNINKNISQLAVYNKKEVIALCKELNVEIPSFIYEYFGKEEDFTPNENYNRYRQVMDCGELLKIANQSVISEKYKQAIGIIVSNVLNDLGLYNNLDGDYSLNCANGWNKKSIIFDVSNLMKNGKNITAFERKKYRDSILLSIV
ncbi:MULTISPECIES: Rha family transcriptional regulator [Helcococcus]|uniref:Rha family transcriptional regulator n=1 Tax=Helcococcus bovis TaxID=3153252 RepID=A0ABW9F819_9FIRM